MIYGIKEADIEICPNCGSENPQLCFTHFGEDACEDCTVEFMGERFFERDFKEWLCIELELAGQPGIECKRAIEEFEQLEKDVESAISYIKSAQELLKFGG